MNVDPPVAVLVEDNLMFAMMLEPSLQRLGYRVKTLGGGEGLVDRIAAAGPALIVINLTSARFAGAEVVREAKGREDLATVPVVGYAGHVEREFFVAGRAAGADLVVPNSAMRKALPEVLAKLERLRAGESSAEEDWPE